MFCLRPLPPLSYAALRQGQNAHSLSEDALSLSPRLQIRGWSPKKNGKDSPSFPCRLHSSLNVLSLTNLLQIPCNLITLRVLLCFNNLSKFSSLFLLTSLLRPTNVDALCLSLRLLGGAKVGIHENLLEGVTPSLLLFCASAAESGNCFLILVAIDLA
jgi:hypothetical protein